MNCKLPSLHYGVECSPYITAKCHKYLSDDFWRENGANVGDRGENLTITFLTMNRSGLSMRFCESIVKHIPDFAGELLAVDNGSTSQEIEKLREFLQTLPFRWRLHCLGRNFGASGGRNRAMLLIKTPWVMSVDNDVYFISNPLASIQDDIARLGCHFLGLSVLNQDEKTSFIRGGHLYLSPHAGEFIIGGGGAVHAERAGANGTGFLCTFMSGCASVFRKDTFLNVGGFDEGMFVGFEDIEFSVRLFRAGLKVGASDTHALVHAHPAPSTSADMDYEKQRFSRLRIKEAAAYFERKHGYKVWTEGVASWLAQRENELGLPNPELATAARQPAGEVAPASTGKPRIALIVDRPDWALANIAYQLERRLSDEFDIDVIAMPEIGHNPVLAAYMTRSHALVHFFWRETLRLIYTEHCSRDVDYYFGSLDKLNSIIGTRPTTFSVYDHLFLSDEDIASRIPLFTEHSTAYTVSSRRLEDHYRSISAYPAPAALTPDGVDLERFTPAKLDRLTQVGHRPLRVGWVGNSAWGVDVLTDPKGFNTILQPALEQLREQGAKVEGVFADRKVQYIPHHRMPDYYGSIDVLICVSTIEGTPNPVLEAMACGLPVISTDVGIVPEVFGPLQKEFILEERNVECLKSAVARLIGNGELLKSLSDENLERIRDWDWSIRAEAFRSFFRKILQNAIS
ncbi:MAG: glycosyltransferase [Roseiarcus sp.]